MLKNGETGLGGEQQYDDLDVHVHPFAPTYDARVCQKSSGRAIS